jgi:hypothetical protein
LLDWCGSGVVLGGGDHGGQRLVEVVGDPVAVRAGWLVEHGVGALLADQRPDPRAQERVQGQQDEATSSQPISSARAALMAAAPGRSRSHGCASTSRPLALDLATVLGQGAQRHFAV